MCTVSINDTLLQRVETLSHGLPPPLGYEGGGQRLLGRGGEGGGGEGESEFDSHECLETWINID